MIKQKLNCNYEDVYFEIHQKEITKSNRQGKGTQEQA